jgi:hypothetical protein
MTRLCSPLLTLEWIDQYIMATEPNSPMYFISRQRLGEEDTSAMNTHATERIS